MREEHVYVCTGWCKMVQGRMGKEVTGGGGGVRTGIRTWEIGGPPEGRASPLGALVLMGSGSRDL